VMGFLNDDPTAKLTVNATYLMELLKCFDKNERVTIEMYNDIKSNPLVLKDQRDKKLCLLTPINT